MVFNSVFKALTERSKWEICIRLCLRIMCFKKHDVYLHTKCFAGLWQEHSVTTTGIFHRGWEPWQVHRENFAIHNNMFFVCRGGGERSVVGCVSRVWTPTGLVTYAEGLCKLGQIQQWL
jgi:hypothetical protein